MPRQYSALTVVLLLGWFVSIAAAQTCQYSPYWGVDGELWDPSGPLKDWSTVGYHQGDEPVPYQQRPASLTFGPGVHTITDRILISSGVLRGAGMDQTTLYFPKGMVGMGYPCDWDDCGNWDWDGAVITATGTEIGIEDLTVEFGPHSYSHHNGKGFNGISLGAMQPGGTVAQCVNCWISHVRVLNADDAIYVRGHHNTVEHSEVFGRHVQITTITGHHNLVTHNVLKGRTMHGLSAAWTDSMNVFANSWGEPMHIEPDHNTGGPTHHNLFSNLQGTARKISRKIGDNVLWNFMNTKLCPVDLYEAQLMKRVGP